jgi:hypothetical protein
MKVDEVKYPAGGTLGKIKTTAGGNRAVVMLTAAFQPAASVNVILYIHGHWATERTGVKSFDQLIAHPDTAKIMSEVQGSGKSLALGIPDMGSYANKTDWISDKGSFDALLGDILLFAAQRANELSVNQCLKDPSIDAKTNKKVLPLQLGSLILAAHSGGGYPLGRIMGNKSGFHTNVKEIWMFDALYGGAGSPETWIAYATKTNTKIHVFYNDTKRNSLALDELRKGNPAVHNIKPAQPTPNHDKAPGAHIGKLVKDSADL